MLNDPFGQAFGEFGINPNDPFAKDKLLARLLERHPSNHRPGRPQGTIKRDGRWYVQFVLDVLQIHRERLDRNQLLPIDEAEGAPSNSELAIRLQQKFPERYGAVTPAWLRQRLSLQNAPLITADDLLVADFAPIDQETIECCLKVMRWIFTKITEDDARLMLLHALLYHHFEKLFRRPPDWFLAS